MKKGPSMKTIIKNVASVTCLAALATLVAGAQPATNPAPAQALAVHPPGARIQFDQVVHDFGRITGGQIVKHTFAFTNVGDQLLELSNVQPSCGCTTAGDWSRKVEPGQAGTIPIQFNSGNFSGEIHKTITVTSNDRGQPQTVLQIKGSIWKPLEVTPQFAVLNVIPESPSNSPVKVKILNNTDSPVTLSAPESSNRSFHAELHEVKTGKEFELTVSAVPPLSPGNVQGNISIKTSMTNLPLITVVAWANVQPIIAVSPQQIILPRAPLPNKMSPSVMIQNRGTNLLELSEAKVNVEGVEIELKELQPGRSFNATLTFPQGFEIQPGTPVELTFKSNHPQHPLIKVPVMQMPRPATQLQGQAPKVQPPVPRPVPSAGTPPPLPPASVNTAGTPRPPASSQ
jgi:Protein of unknown function (DUF1573)